MVLKLLEQFAVFGSDLMSFLPPGIILILSTAFIESGKYFDTFRREFVGSLLMIMFTFSAGKWVGKESLRTAWTSHFFGVIAADKLGGGQHVNPAVTVSMFTLGKCTYTEAFVRIAAQLGGGLVAFPVFHAISNAMEWEPFGGPQFNMDQDQLATAVGFVHEEGLFYSLHVENVY